MIATHRDPAFLRPERARTVELVPMIGCVGLFLQHVMDEALPAIAATNGEAVIVRPDFFAMKSSDRNGVLLHEYMHVALSHNHRAAIFKRKEGASYDHTLMNIAMDMFINRAITTQFRTSSYITLPDNLIHWHEIEAEVTAYNKTTKDSPWQAVELPKFESSTCEGVYKALKSIKERAQDCVNKANNLIEGGSGNANDNDEEVKPTPQQSHAAQKFLGRLETLDDIQETEGKDLSELRKEIAQNTARFENSMKQHGTRSGGMVDALKGDLPQPQVPWQAEFRSVTQRHLSRARTKHPTRPAKSVLSQVSLGQNNIIWNAGRRRTPVPRAALVLDSSGSVDLKVYQAYLAEVDGLIKRTGAEITVIVADADIQGIYQIRNTQDIPKIEFKGRGGTDFRPALEWIDKNGFDLAIYLTDLGGTFPEKTTTPVLWVGPENPSGENHKAPIGRTIWIEQ